MDNSDIVAVLGDRATAAPHLDTMGRRLVQLMEDLLRTKGIKWQSVTYRVKDEESLRRKLERSEGKYRRLADVTDILGMRVITYFPDDVDKVATIVRQNFALDEANCVDKRAILDPDRFGYLSLHYVATMSRDRLSLPEYASYEGQKFEIQMRSVLQHAWAEIEHDSGYHTTESIPTIVRRRFSRLAGLLELADMEFVGIRDEVDRYVKALAKSVPTTLDVPIDRHSIMQLIASSSTVARIDDSLMPAFGAKRKEQTPEVCAALEAEELHLLGHNTLSDVEEDLRKCGSELPAFATRWLDGSSHQSITRGICLYYLFLYRVGERLSEKTDDQIVRFLKRTFSSASSMPDGLVKAYRGVTH